MARGILTATHQSVTFTDIVICGAVCAFTLAVCWIWTTPVSSQIAITPDVPVAQMQRAPVAVASQGSPQQKHQEPDTYVTRPDSPHVVLDPDLIGPHSHNPELMLAHERRKR